MCRVVPAVLLVLIVFSNWWVPLSGIRSFGLGEFIMKAIELPLAFLLFKVLGHEAQRYREISPDLPPSLRR
jgi:hypothetical protein